MSSYPSIEASSNQYDVVVVGAGPNGLAAAVELARSKLSVWVVEAQTTAGGGARTEELTAPGFFHDVCSAVHPLGAASPFFRSLPLERYGVEWIHSPSALAHVVSAEEVVTLERSVDETADGLGEDGDAYRKLIEPYIARFDDLAEMILAPLRFPSHPWLLARFGLSAIRSARGLSGDLFRGSQAAALFGGMAAHAMLPLDSVATASFGMVLAAAGHHVGWPIAKGGSRAITNALLACLREHGGEVRLGARVANMRQLPSARAYVFDVTPKQLLDIAGDALPSVYRKRLQAFRYGPGIYKMDWALSQPIPWKNPRCARAATVHLAGTLEDVHRSEGAVHSGTVSARPFVLVVQSSLFDATRAPAGMHTAWAYCHVPHGDRRDVSSLIEAQIERYAPGFRDCVIARSTRDTFDVERHDENFIGGDINGGVSDLAQLFFRPMAKIDPHSTPRSDLFICSSSTPPGGGVHGMCGYWAARSVLRNVFGRSSTPL